MKKIEPNNILRIFLGIIFLSAGIYRVFNWDQAILEFSQLDLESYFIPVIAVILEIISGIFLIFNRKTKNVLLGLIIFMILAVVSTLLSNGSNIISNLGELFILNSTPTDLFLHLTYLIILIYLSIKE